MTTLSVVRQRVGMARQTIWAFLAMGFQTTVSYPLGFVMSQLTVILPLFVYLFVAELVTSTPSLGNDYFTYVVVGLFGLQAINAGMVAFGHQLDVALNRGWFEMILVEPIRWTLVPLAMAAWPVIMGLASSLVVALLALPLGATYDTAGIYASILILILGVIAGLGVGILSASLKVLAKQGNPLLHLYSFAAQLLSGVYFPVENLPDWIRPLAWLLPHTYVISALRKTLMVDSGQLAGPDFGTALTGLAVFALVILPLALWLFSRAMEYGRKLGVLSGY